MSELKSSPSHTLTETLLIDEHDMDEMNMSHSPEHDINELGITNSPEHDINELGISHSGEDYSANNYEEIEYHESLDCTHEEVMTTEETIVIEGSACSSMEQIEIDTEIEHEIEEDIEHEIEQEIDHEIETEEDIDHEVEAELDPEFDTEIEAEQNQDDIEMTEVCDEELVNEELEELEELEIDESPTLEVLPTTPSNKNNKNIVFQTKSTLQKVQSSSKQNVPTTVQSQSYMIVTPAGGQGPNQVLKISHPPGASPGQLQSIAQKIITAKSADGSIVHLRSAQSGKPLVATTQGSNMTVSNVQKSKTIPTTIKRTVQGNQQNRNVSYTKMIISGGNQQNQESFITSSSQDTQPQTIKYYTTSSSNPITNSTKSMSVGQSQMNFVVQQQQQQQQQQPSVSKVHHNVIPISTQKKQQNVYSNKIGQSSSSQPPKLTAIQGKSTPAKILPAPTMSPQIRPAMISNSQMQFTTTTTKSSSQQNPQKVIIRQSGIKSGTVLGSGQVIRIPSNQNIVNSNQVHQIQMSGSRQLQYVRLVSTPSSSPSTSNVMTVGKPKTQHIQTMGVTQRMSSGQQQIVKVVPINQSNQQLRTVAPKSTMSTMSTQRILIPATPGQNKNSVGLSASRISQLASGQAILSSNSNVGNIVVLPASFMQQQQQQQQQNQQQHQQSHIQHQQHQYKHFKKSTFTPPPKDFLDPIKPSIPIVYNSPTPKNSASSLAGNLSTISELPHMSSPILPTLTPKSASKSASSPVDSNGIRPRKPCNCTKSQCLKLYCDCFANGEFCNSCNCNNCSNNLSNEEERQKAIKSCLERNPNAFRPKIGKARDSGADTRRHNKGCNCKRSGCLKNYCECYEAKIPCSGNCKCIGCRNVEDPVLEKKSLKDLADAAEVRTTQILLDKARMRHLSSMAFRPPATSNTGIRQPFNFLTDKVVEITCQCLLAQAEETERNMFDEETSQRLIIEEFGRCLKEIIESAHKAEASNSQS